MYDNIIEKLEEQLLALQQIIEENSETMKFGEIMPLNKVNIYLQSSIIELKELT